MDVPVYRYWSIANAGHHLVTIPRWLSQKILVTHGLPLIEIVDYHSPSLLRVQWAIWLPGHTKNVIPGMLPDWIYLIIWISTRRIRNCLKHKVHILNVLHRGFLKMGAPKLPSKFLRMIAKINVVWNLFTTSNPHSYSFINVHHDHISLLITTWWIIPLSKWLIFLVIKCYKVG